MDGLSGSASGATAAVREGCLNLAGDLIVGWAAQRDAAGLGGFLNARRQIDAIAVGVAALDNNVAQVDADAEFDRPVGHGPLYGHGAIHRVYDAGKLDQGAVGYELDHTALVGRYLGRKDIRAQGLERRQSAVLIGPDLL